MRETPEELEQALARLNERLEAIGEMLVVGRDDLAEREIAEVTAEMNRLTSVLMGLARDAGYKGSMNG